MSASGGTNEKCGHGIAYPNSEKISLRQHLAQASAHPESMR
jgi:hypothetical protein